MTTASLQVDRAQARRLLLGHVARALARLRAQEALRAAVVVLTAALWVLVPLTVADRLFSLTQLGLSSWLLWLVLLALGLPYVAWRVLSRRLNARAAAALSDERLGLHARLSTMLALEAGAAAGFDEAFHAEAAARLAHLDLARALPVRLPRLAYLLPLPAVLAACVWFFMEPQDRLGWLAQAQAQRRAADARKQSVAKLRDMNLQDLKKNLTDRAAEESAQYKVNQLIKKGQDVAKQVQDGKLNAEQALQALADLKKEIGEKREELRPDQDFADRLKQLKTEDLNLAEGDLTRQVSEALKEGNPDAAAREMRRLAQKLREELLKNSKLSAQEKAEALKKLRREVERLAGALAENQALKEDLKELAQKAQDAGEFEELQDSVKEQLAKDGKTEDQAAAELEKAMELTAEELEALEEGEIAEALDELEGNVDEALAGVSPSGKGARPAGQKTARVRLSGAKARLLAQKIKPAPGQGGSKGDGGRGKGDGSKGQGPPGSGLGEGPGVGARPEAESGEGFKATRVRGQLQSGAITALSHFRGQGATGEVPREYVNALTTAEQEAASSVELERIPADAREMVKQYFSSLKQDANAPKSVEGGAGAPPAGEGPAGGAPAAPGRSAKSDTDAVLKQ